LLTWLTVVYGGWKAPLGGGEGWRREALEVGGPIYVVDLGGFLQEGRVWLGDDQVNGDYPALREDEVGRFGVVNEQAVLGAIPCENVWHAFTQHSARQAVKACGLHEQCDVRKGWRWTYQPRLGGLDG